MGGEGRGLDAIDARHAVAKTQPYVSHKMQEGGYNLKSTAAGMEACVRVLLGEEPLPLAPDAAPTRSGLESIMQCLQEHCKFWHSARRCLREAEQCRSHMGPEPECVGEGRSTAEVMAAAAVALRSDVGATAMEVEGPPTVEMLEQEDSLLLPQTHPLEPLPVQVEDFGGQGGMPDDGVGEMRSFDQVLMMEFDRLDSGVNAQVLGSQQQQEEVDSYLDL